MDATVENTSGSLNIGRREAETALAILSAVGRPSNWDCRNIMHNHGYSGYPQTWIQNEGWTSIGPPGFVAIATIGNGSGGVNYWSEGNYWSGSRRYAIESSFHMPFAFGGQMVCW